MRQYKIQIDRAGFTFVEVMLVVLLIGLFASVTGGFYMASYNRMLVKKCATDFMLAAKYARITAVEKQCRCTIKTDTVAGMFFLTAEEKSQSPQAKEVAVRDLYFKPVRLSGKLKFEDIKIKPVTAEQINSSENRNTITFYSNGTADNAVVQIGDGENHFTVKVSAVTGRAGVYEGLAAEAVSDSVDLDEVQQ